MEQFNCIPRSIHFPFEQKNHSKIWPPISLIRTRFFVCLMKQTIITLLCTIKQWKKYIALKKNSEWKEDFAKYTFLSALSALFLGDLEEIFNFS